MESELSAWVSSVLANSENQSYLAVFPVYQSQSQLKSRYWAMKAATATKAEEMELWKRDCELSELNELNVKRVFSQVGFGNQCWLQPTHSTGSLDQINVWLNHHHHHHPRHRHFHYHFHHHFHHFHHHYHYCHWQYWLLWISIMTNFTMTSMTTAKLASPKEEEEESVLNTNCQSSRCKWKKSVVTVDGDLLFLIIFTFTPSCTQKYLTTSVSSWTVFRVHQTS